MDNRFIPEWEIEEAIVRNPLVLDEDILRDSELIQRQFRIKKNMYRIDLLYKRNSTYLVVEIKNHEIINPEPIINQLISYQKALIRYLHIPSDLIELFIVSPFSIGKSVQEIFTTNGIHHTKANLDLIESHMPVGEKRNAALINQLYRIRYGEKPDMVKKEIYTLDEIVIRDRTKTIESWISTRQHDYISLADLADEFKLISKQAPIMAHDINEEGPFDLRTFEDQWFWLFYSVLDRRANAITFINAKRALEKEDMFLPHSLAESVESREKSETISIIHHVLNDAAFPLVPDSNLGEYAMPTSILDAALFIQKYSYDFLTLSSSFEDRGDETVSLLWDEISDSIYGVGDRITAQIIRGMVHKGPWNYSLNDDRFLERTKFNIFFAGKARLALIENPSEFKTTLSSFTDTFLEGDKGIISHVLWYIRKRYCYRKPLCSECPLSGYCTHYLKDEIRTSKKICNRKIDCEECDLKFSCGYFYPIPEA